MLSNVDKLKSRIKSKGTNVTIATEFYFLAKELGCLGDLLGREYELVYDNGRLVRVIQKPIPVPAFITMMNEMEKDYKNQEKAAKKAKRRRR